MKANYIVIAGDDMMTSFMQAADMFDDSKVVASAYEMCITFTEGKASMKKAADAMENLRTSLEKSGKKPICIHLQSVEGEGVVKENRKIDPFVDRKVRSISDGKSWMMLCDTLTKLGLEVETDEHMFVTEAKIKTN